MPVVISLLGNQQRFTRSLKLCLPMGVRGQSRIVLRGDILPGCKDAIVLHREAKVGFLSILDCYVFPT